jgi:hypothetical protein
MGADMINWNWSKKAFDSYQGIASAMPHRSRKSIAPSGAGGPAFIRNVQRLTANFITANSGMPEGMP